jgi:hypothetical protein
MITRNSEKSTYYICFFSSVMIGIVLGYFTLKSIKVGAFFVGGWLGYVISLIFYSSFLFKIETNPPEVNYLI